LDLGLRKRSHFDHIGPVDLVDLREQQTHEMVTGEYDYKFIDRRLFSSSQDVDCFDIAPNSANTACHGT